CTVAMSCSENSTSSAVATAGLSSMTRMVDMDGARIAWAGGKGYLFPARRSRPDGMSYGRGAPGSADVRGEAAVEGSVDGAVAENLVGRGIAASQAAVSATTASAYQGVVPAPGAFRWRRLRFIRCGWRWQAGSRRRAAPVHRPPAGPAATAAPRRWAGSTAAGAPVRTCPSAPG